MNPLEVCTDPRFTLLCGAGNRPIESVYCGDLLSLVMGRAPAGCPWVTVMRHLNSIAVAVLTDVTCILLAEGLTVVATFLPVYEAALACDTYHRNG